MRPFPLMLFAAGLGTRMGALTATMPKPLIPVAGKPLLDHALALADHAGITTRVANLHYLGDHPDKPQWINGAIRAISRRLDVVVSSAFEAELGGTFMNATESLAITRVLTLLGHAQLPTTDITGDNSVAVDVCNGRSAQRRHKSIDMRFEWIICRTKQKQFHVHWRPGIDNLADYFTKKHSTQHHKDMRRFFVSDPPPLTAPDTPSARRNARRA